MMRYAVASQIECWMERDGAIGTFTMDNVEAVRIERVSRDCYLVGLETSDGEAIIQFRAGGGKPCMAVIL